MNVVPHRTYCPVYVPSKGSRTGHSPTSCFNWEREGAKNSSKPLVDGTRAHRPCGLACGCVCRVGCFGTHLSTAYWHFCLYATSARTDMYTYGAGETGECSR